MFTSGFRMSKFNCKCSSVEKDYLFSELGCFLKDILQSIRKVSNFSEGTVNLCKYFIVVILLFSKLRKNYPDREIIKVIFSFNIMLEYWRFYSILLIEEKLTQL
jgi:hypothetical protein